MTIPWTNRPAVLPDAVEPPRLRFIAWQDQWKQKEGEAVVRLDGTRVVDSAEASVLRQVYPAEGAGVRVISFEFATPLAEVARFRLGTRPIRRQEWPNVVLPAR